MGGPLEGAHCREIVENTRGVFRLENPKCCQPF